MASHLHFITYPLAVRFGTLCEIKAAIAAGRMMNKYQNSFSMIRRLIVEPITPFLSFAHTAPKPTSSGTRLSHPSGCHAIQGALILVLLCLLPLLASTRASAQKKDETPNLLDMSLEDLMSIEIDSVYGASGIQAEGDGSARLRHDHYIRRNPKIRLPDSCRHLTERPRFLCHLRPKL